MDTVIELFEHAVATHGPRRALVIKPGFRTHTWSHAAIGDLVPRVARSLRDAGVRPGDRVLIWAVNRPEWGISYLALLWAGAVAVPLDYRTTHDLALRVAGQTRPALVLASLQTADAARQLELPALTIESLVSRAATVEPLERPEVRPDDLAEIVFTSGTTGDPKGVMLSHRNIASNTVSLMSVIPLGPDTRLLSMLPLSHMYGLNPGFLAPMLAGASVVFPSSLQPTALTRAFREQRVTMLLTVPQVVKLLTNSIERQVDASGRRALFERLHAVAPMLPIWARRILFRSVLSRLGGALRYIAVGAAAMNPNIARRWEEMGVMSLQGYGATEASPAVAFTRIERNRIGTVGEVIPGVEVRIAPDGEILVRGPNVFQGYWERPDATAAALQDGWYHTGDHGDLDEDGFLTLRGRKKDMLVMADGTKVHPADIEEVLIQDPRVRDAAVVGLERPDTDVQVHAVLILDETTSGDSVVEQANARLAGHQQIRGWTRWPEPEFPRNPMFKVRKSEIVSWILSQGHSAAPSSVSALALAAASAVERLLGRIEGVPLNAIQADARLSSDLGLDSLGRIELLSLVEEELGVFVDDAELDPDETVGSLQARVDASSGVTPPAEQGFGWPLNPVIGTIRNGLQAAVVRPLVGAFYRCRVTGLEHLEGVTGPVLFTPNHHLHLDNPIILSAIPSRFRRRLSVAAAADDIFGNRLAGFVAAVVGNAFPMAREGAVRRSLDLLGARIDRGYSVLLYPEGRLTVGGPLQEFMPGIGLVAVHGGIPVVPMWLHVHRASRIDKGLDGKTLRGDVEVAFGAPLRFDPDADPARATGQIRDAVNALRPSVQARSSSVATRPLPAGRVSP